MRKRLYVIAVLITSLAGCATQDLGPGVSIAERSQFYEAECVLGTESSHVEQFHALVHYPFEHSLRFPGLIVGIEKSSADVVKHGATKAEKELPSPKTDETRALHRLLFGGSKSMFISHVVRMSDVEVDQKEDQQKDLAQGRDSSIYNLYENRAAARIEDKYAKIGGPLNCHRQPVKDLDAFGESWQAVKAIKTTIAHDLSVGGYTDIVVISMGWNTPQIEAVQNFNSLVHQLSNAAGGKSKFKPYVVGITWPSEWTNAWVDPLMRAASLFNKANDADEVGAGWMGAIIRHGVLEVTQDPKYSHLRVDVIGHSFGARATSMAVCNPSVVQPPKELGFNTTEPPNGAVSWLIGLQGAYSLNRDLPDGAGIYHFRYEGCPVAKQQLFTASAHDGVAQLASNILHTAPFSGQIASWEKLQASEGRNMFNFYKASADGDVELVESSSRDATWHYIDASDLVYYNAYGTGAGAHSDIYRIPMGKMLWSFVGRPR